LNRVRAIFVLAVCALSAVAAKADTLTLVTVGPGTAGGPNSTAGVYVYPYYFSINGSSTLTPMICDSYDREVYVGESWTASSSSLAGVVGSSSALAANSSLMEGGQLANLTISQAYAEAAWLYTQMGPDPTSTNADNYNFAIWAIFSSNATQSAGYDAAVKALLDAAYGHRNDSLSTFSNVTVWSPITPTDATYNGKSVGLPQQYFAMTPVPEPGTLALGFTGLFGVAFAIRRKG